MPCTDGGPMPSFRPDADDMPGRCIHENDLRELKTKVDNLTDLLCSLFKHIERQELGMKDPPGKLMRWWKKHQKEDAKGLSKSK